MTNLCLFYAPRFPNNDLLEGPQALPSCPASAAPLMVQFQLNNAHSPAYVSVITKTNRLVALGRQSLCDTSNA